MIPELTTIGNDELFSTYINYTAGMNGAVTPYQKRQFFNDTLGETFGTGQKTEDIRYFINLENICRAEKDSKVFPGLKDILLKHTDLYAMAPFWIKGEQARRFEYNLHEQGRKNKIIGPFSKSPGLKICPECAKEDGKNYDREIIHAPHQLYVNACWKHGCCLVDSNDPMQTEPASMQEIEKAVFMHDLYANPAITCFERTQDAIEGELKKRGMTFMEALRLTAEDGYTDKSVCDLYYMKSRSVKTTNEFYDAYLGMLVWLFKNAENFKASLEPWDPASEYTHDDFELLEQDGYLAEFKCRTCGHEFTMHPDAAEYGSACPACSRKMTRVEIYRRYADRLDDGEYDIYETDGKIHVIHKECGHDMTFRFPLNVWRRGKCKICQRKKKHEAFIGKQNRSVYGRLMTIVNYKSSADIDVQFEDGETCTTSYANFSAGWVKSRLDLPIEEKRIGEKKINTQGQEMQISTYRNYNDVDVTFENGTVVPHRSYEEFRLGMIRNPKRLVGMRRINAQGIGMEVTDYHNCHDFTVRFDTGDVITATSLESFMAGKTKCPSAGRQRIGEKGINNQGIGMEIIDYRACDDMDVKFETGYVAEGVSYYHFRKGEIGCPDWYSYLKTGERNVNNQGIGMEIIACRNSRDIDIQFDTGDIVTKKRYSRFKDGSIRCPGISQNKKTKERGNDDTNTGTN